MRSIKFFLLPLVFSLAFFFAPQALAFYDLTVTALSASPASPAKGEPVVITATVKNVGEDPSPADALSAYQANFQNFTQEGVILPAATPLAKDGTATFKFSGYFSADGAKDLYFRVNPEETVATNREPNYLEAEIIVLKPYDLYVQDIVLYPAKPGKNQHCQIKVQIKNNGFAPIRSAAEGISSYTKTFPDFVQSRETRPLVDSSHNLNKGESVYFVYEGKFTAEGEKELKFAIDVNDYLDEKDENNNSLAKKLAVASLNDVDIKVNSISVAPERPILGQDAVIKVEILNDGKVSLVTDAGLRRDDNVAVVPTIKKDLQFVFPDFRVDEFTADKYPEFSLPLDPGGKFYYTLTGKFTLIGDKKLAINANINNRLEEADTADDYLDRTITVYASEAERDSFDIRDIRVKPISSTAVEIVWKTDVSAKSFLSYKQSAHTGWKDQLEKEGRDFAVELSGLSPNLSYDYTIEALNGTVKKTKKGLKFTTPSDNEFAFTGTADAAVDGQSVAFRWQTSLRTLSSLFYRRSGDQAWLEKKIPAPDTGFQESLDNIADGDYEWQVEAAPAAGAARRTAINIFTIGVPASSPTGPSPDQACSDCQADPLPAAVPALSLAPAKIKDQALYSRLKGRIILTVEQKGEAYYLHPNSGYRYFLGRPDDAFVVMREQGIGIKSADLVKIPVGLAPLSGPDTDGDGLSDLFEDAVGTNKTKADTDGDGHDDKTEIMRGYDPIGAKPQAIAPAFAQANKGKIFLQVEAHGEAWYLSPQDGKRYFLGRPADAFAVMRTLGLGIGDGDFGKL